MALFLNVRMRTQGCPLNICISAPVQLLCCAVTHQLVSSYVHLCTFTFVFNLLMLYWKTCNVTVELLKSLFWSEMESYPCFCRSFLRNKSQGNLLPNVHIQDCILNTGKKELKSRHFKKLSHPYTVLVYNNSSLERFGINWISPKHQSCVCFAGNRSH